MEIEIFEEDGSNTLSLSDKDVDFTINVDTESKTYRSRMSLNDDVYYRTENFQYRISVDPIRLEVRLVARLDEPPPDKYSVKDGVVLESEILADRGELMASMTKEFINGLKKEVEWHEEWVGDPVSMYLLLKHPEIISPDDYRRHLRQLAEKIKSATLKVRKALELDKTGLQITDEYEGSGRAIWYSKSKQDGMSEEEINDAIKHQKKVQERLFDEKSNEYVGISESEFRSSDQILKYIDVFLSKKSAPTKKEEKNKASFGINFGAFIIKWIWLFVVVSVALGLLSLIVNILQYDFTFAFVTSGILAFSLILRQNK
ncbi:MAG: hypothetical protein ACD_81C00219G0002 [uncultured bacterium]|uniref:Uncharacterized protein n=2 Tax=Candidatus Wolfeibacteriota TaxID=1752735 RepID=A0A0G1H8L3_9BACT|nr:MAG: hypothetical protein ACD_81C00219G0002 [uncultured bacterium]KKR12775.1 MAG: hypothetical protein UT41_C0001G0319 [Candidatus Wolfebacteria bacterium GW2011_GWC2_39_22]KKT43706.1 MAG: hypothetical protein UW32_C0001G0298 [Candidatus Wolfebacteria bacterium GW2011_GWE2_44_13]HBI25563.1 hypothetical protein [Candidatus Wolfebacteria bacterium]